MRIQSHMTHKFSNVPKAEIMRSAFDRSFGHKTTLDSGYLVPVLIDEALPGDTFNVDMTAFARMATPVFPIMDNMYMESFFFAVPLRLLWSNFQRFMGEQPNPGDSTDFLVPTISSAAGGFVSGSIYDYMGLPVAGSTVDPTGVITVSSLPLRAYNLIYNEWFRDQNMQNSVTVRKTDSGDVVGDYTLLRRGKRHDYFTSALPWAQKGDPVGIGLTGQFDVISNDGIDGGTGIPTFKNSVGSARSSSLDFTNGTWGTNYTGVGTAPDATGPVKWDTTSLLVDLEDQQAVTINALRQAIQLQKMYEKDARGGTRYTEIIYSHYNVQSPDARMQRPEYLGGGSSPIIVTPIAQTSSTDTETPQGNLAAMATVSLRNHGFTKSFTEHCVIIGLVNVRADLTYQQGIERQWLRRTRNDFYWPSFATIGEQAITQKEIYATGIAGTDAGEDDHVFGYQERYAEYRYKPSLITGKFRSTIDDPLDSWHLAQEFSSAPELNSTFIVENPPMARVKAVSTQPDFIFDSIIKMKCVRPMPLYGVPGNMDRF